MQGYPLGGTSSAWEYNQGNSGFNNRDKNGDSNLKTVGTPLDMQVETVDMPVTGLPIYQTKVYPNAGGEQLLNNSRGDKSEVVSL